MQISEKEMAVLVDKVTKEVRKIIGEPAQLSGKIYGTVALVCEIIPAPKKAFDFIKTEYGADTEFYLLNGVQLEESEFLTITVETDEDKRRLMQRLANAKSILLISPSVGTLMRIEEGNDDNFSDLCVVRSILWGRDVHVVLDFNPPKFKRGTLFEKVVSSIDALTSMGVKVDVYKTAENESEDKFALVTEMEIKDAHKNGEKTVVCDKQAIVTPLAKDTAKELKVNIERV